jgi:hypothetical protein
MSPLTGPMDTSALAVQGHTCCALQSETLLDTLTRASQTLCAVRVLPRLQTPAPQHNTCTVEAASCALVPHCSINGPRAVPAGTHASVACKDADKRQVGSRLCTTAQPAYEQLHSLQLSGALWSHQLPIKQDTRVVLGAGTHVLCLLVHAKALQLRNCVRCAKLTWLWLQPKLRCSAEGIHWAPYGRRSHLGTGGPQIFCPGQLRRPSLVHHPAVEGSARVWHRQLQHQLQPKSIWRGGCSQKTGSPLS